LSIPRSTPGGSKGMTTMAFVMLVPNKISAFGVTIDRVYNVDFDVGGPRSSGLRSDVQLVQSLLKFRFASGRHNVRSLKTGRILTDLNVDGIYGPATADAISSYQHYIWAKPDGHQLMLPDGIVSRANPTGVSTISKTGYTIVYLNIHLKLSTGGELDPLFMFPDEPLRSDLKRSLDAQGLPAEAA
jgi:peptidoglycan hydrolase-like protein with peptidoglycan-binding domain